MVTKRAGTPQAIIKNSQCPRCYLILPEEDSYEVSFAMIINEHQKRHNPIPSLGTKNFDGKASLRSSS